MAPVDVELEFPNAIATEIVGVLGHRVRVYKERALLRTLECAREIAEKEGLTLKVPGIKFLVPFLEDCSLERDDDERMIEMWANLLISESKQSRSENCLFIRLLGEMTSEEAKVLRYIASPESHDHYERWYAASSLEGHWEDSHVYICLKEMLGKHQNSLTEDYRFDELEWMFRKQYEMPGSSVTVFSVSFGRKNSYPYTVVNDPPRHCIDEHFDPISLPVLHNLGLVQQYRSSELWFGRICFEIVVEHLTELGVQFVRACTNIKMPHLSEIGRECRLS